jgi:hypothetical protein
MALESTQPLTEMSTRSLPGDKGWPALKCDNLTTMCEPIVYKCGSLDVSQPYGPPCPVTGVAMPFTSLLLCDSATEENSSDRATLVPNVAETKVSIASEREDLWKAMEQLQKKWIHIRPFSCNRLRQGESSLVVTGIADVESAWSQRDYIMVKGRNLWNSLSGSEFENLWKISFASHILHFGLMLRHNISLHISIFFIFEIM